jgi:hypothetical protein
MVSGCRPSLICIVSLRLTWPVSETGRQVAAKTWPTDADVSLILKGSVGPLLRDDAAALQAISTAFLSALVPQSAAADLFGRGLAL